MANNGKTAGRFKKAKVRAVSKTKLVDLTGEGLEGGEMEAKADASMETYTKLKKIITDEQGELLGNIFGDDILIDWNLVNEEDEPLPANGQGMARLPSSMSVSIVVDWLNSLEQVAAPLGSESSNGGISEAELLEMGESSKSLPLSEKPA